MLRDEEKIIINRELFRLRSKVRQAPTLDAALIHLQRVVSTIDFVIRRYDFNTITRRWRRAVKLSEKAIKISIPDLPQARQLPDYMWRQLVDYALNPIAEFREFFYRLYPTLYPVFTLFGNISIRADPLESENASVEKLIQKKRMQLKEELLNRAMAL